MTQDEDTIDLTSFEAEGDLKVRLDCTKCDTDRTKPVRHQSDPKSVVRCAECGKKHGTDSLTVV